MKIKKIFVLLFIIILISCSKADGIVKNPENAIIGKWKAIKLGNVVLQLGLSLPITYNFTKQGTFTSSLVAGGIKKIYTGRFKLNSSANPVEIITELSNGRIFHGIIEFINRNKFKMVLFDKKVLPIAQTFGNEDIQIYKRMD